MSNALATLCETTTYALAGEPVELSEYYGCPINFSHTTFRHSALPGAGYRFALQIARQEFRRPAAAFYSRHLNALWLNAHKANALAYEAHSMPGTNHAQWLLKQIAAHPKCRAIVCITQLLAEDLKKILPAATNVVVLPDAADLPGASSSSKKLLSWPGRSGAPQIGYVGHLYKGKGVELIKHLAQASPEWDFHIVGGREVDIQYWKKSNPPENLHFHGFIRHADLSMYYNRFDFALLPVEAEVWTADQKNEIGRWTSPLKAFEYMAHRIPIIASDTLPLREIFTDKLNSLLVEPGAVPAWKSAIEQLLRDPTFAEKLAENAWQTFHSKHTWSARAAEVVKLLT